MQSKSLAFGDQGLFKVAEIGKCHSYGVSLLELHYPRCRSMFQTTRPRGVMSVSFILLYASKRGSPI